MPEPKEEPTIGLAKTMPANDTSKILLNQGQGGSLYLFPTVCYVKPHANLEEMNKELEAFALQQEKEEEGLKKALLGRIPFQPQIL